MSKSKKLIITSISILAIGGILFGANFYIQKFRGVNTFTNSKVTSEKIIDGSDLSDSKISNVTDINLDGWVYLNDLGLQSIFVKTGQDSQKTAQDMANWFFTKTAQDTTTSTPTEIKVKGAELNINNDTIYLHGASGLANYITAVNATTVVSGDDLIILAYPEKNPFEQSMIVINNTNPTNYSFVNNTDRWGAALFTIPKQSYAYLRIQRWQNIGGEFIYKTGDTNYTLYTVNDTLYTPPKTNISFKPRQSDMQSETLYYLVDTEDGSGGKNTAFMEAISDDFNKAIAHNTINQLGKKIVGFAKLTQYDKEWNLTFTTSDRPNQALIGVSHGFSKIYFIRTNEPFDVSLTDTPTDYMPYTKSLTSVYQLATKDIRDSLQKILTGGTWDGKLEQIYQTYPGYSFVYKIQPKQKYEGEITVRSVFGHEKKIPLSLYIDEIDPRVITKSILSNNSMSILPDAGSFKDVLVQYKNISSFPVTFQACELQDKTDGSTNKGMGLENYFFSCKGEEYTANVTTKDFVYWKAYRTPVTLPAGFPTDTKAFKVTVPGDANMDQETSHYFLKSDIGIYTKVAHDGLHIWAFAFTDNSPITNGTITITTIDGKAISSTKITGEETIITLPQDLYTTVAVKITTDKSDSFVLVDPHGGESAALPGANPYEGYIYKTINSYLDPQSLTNKDSFGIREGTDSLIKIYGYTDRGLYKAGDTINYAGFVRNTSTFGDLGYLSGKKITVEISDTRGHQLYINTGIALDAFGGFAGSTPTPSTMNIGNAIIRYTLNGSDEVNFSHNIKIEEYEKPTFFINADYENEKNVYNLIIKPEYFFGQELSSYDTKITWNIAPSSDCFYMCRYENTQDYYYNFSLDNSTSTGGEISLYGQDGEISVPLLNKNSLNNKGTAYTLKANIIVRDKNSDSVQFVTKYIDFSPDVKIGLNGNPYTRLYNQGSVDTRKSFTIDGKIAKSDGDISFLGYEIYYNSYDQDLEQGIDGSTYYVNSTKYTLISSGTIGNKTSFSIDPAFIDKAGRYLVRVLAKDSKENILGEVQKQIDYYDFTNSSDGLLGAIPNNYTLTVNIPQKVYKDGEQIPINILPYQKGARVVITVERGGNIIDTIEKVLDGNQLSIPAKKSYSPNITVSVMEIIGTDKSYSDRKEPRFFAGIATADIDTDIHKLNIEISTDKDNYKPGEQVKMTIKTTDNNKNPIDARVSLGVIDQSLLSLYDLIKEPLPYFYNKLGSSVYTYTNMKLLYQSLIAFANNGSKGGGGNGGKAIFSTIREDLSDIAFWKGNIITTGGQTEITFTLPDNITSWVIDTIGITKDSKLGTKRKTIIAKKDLIVEPNTPAFVTIGDQIDIPINLIVAPELAKKNSTIKASATLSNNKGDTIDLGSFNAKGNTKVLLPISIPANRGDATSTTLTVRASAGNNEDSIAKTFPLRTEGLVARESASGIGTNGKHSFTLADYSTGSVSISLGLFPNSIVENMLDVDFESPWTYDLVSNTLLLQKAKELHDSKKLTSTRIIENTIKTINGEKNINDIVQNNITLLLSHQLQNGGFNIRDNKNIQEPDVYQYTITAYVYGGLLQLKSNAPSKASIEKAIRVAGEYLRNYRNLDAQGFIWYLTQKSLAGELLTTQEKTALEKLNPLDYTYGGLLRYVIAVYQKDSLAVTKRKKYATIPTNQGYEGYTLFLNDISAYALKARVVLADQTSSEKDRIEALQNLLGTKNTNNIRGNNIANQQILDTISHIDASTWNTKNPTSCNVIVKDGAKEISNTTIKVSQEGTNPLTLPIAGENLTVDRSCDSNTIASVNLIYKPLSLEKTLSVAEGVTQMHYTIANSNIGIGETTNINAGWSTTKAGEQVVVNIYIPSTYKIVDTLKNKQNANEYTYPFTYSDYDCIPTHRETRYDRLVLYYDNLKPITCDIGLPIMKAYSGTSMVMPLSIQSLVGGTINGRKIIVQ